MNCIIYKSITYDYKESLIIHLYIIKSHEIKTLQNHTYDLNLLRIRHIMVKSHVITIYSGKITCDYHL